MSKIGEEVDVTLKEYEDSSGLAALNKATNAITEPSNMVVNATLGQSSSLVMTHANLKEPKGENLAGKKRPRDPKSTQGNTPAENSMQPRKAAKQ